MHLRLGSPVKMQARARRHENPEEIHCNLNDESIRCHEIGACLRARVSPGRHTRPPGRIRCCVCGGRAVTPSAEGGSRPRPHPCPQSTCPGISVVAPSALKTYWKKHELRHPPPHSGMNKQTGLFRREAPPAANTGGLRSGPDSGSEPQKNTFGMVLFL